MAEQAAVRWYARCAWDRRRHMPDNKGGPKPSGTPVAPATPVADTGSGGRGSGGWSDGDDSPADVVRALLRLPAALMGASMGMLSGAWSESGWDRDAGYGGHGRHERHGRRRSRYWNDD